jgi:hypothetical protein
LCNIFGLCEFVVDISYYQLVKNISLTYQRLTNATAFLLLMAFLIPSGLHAKQLVDFCMMDSAVTEMAADHSCCESDSKETEAETKAHQHHDCDWGFICACSIGHSQLGDEDWIPVSKAKEVILSKADDLSPLISPGEPIPADQHIRIGEYSPPLWLLYDTFLN